jgi:competence protein ComEA
MSFIKDYLSFSRKERTGIMILLILIIGFSLLPFLFPFFLKTKEPDTKGFEKEIAALHVKQTDSTKKYYRKNFDEDNYQNYYQPAEKNYDQVSKGELFFFDPNSASIDDWKRLGVKEKTAETIQKYISKGGKFYKPEDIHKIWGIREDLADRLIPYVKINDLLQANDHTKRNSEQKNDSRPKYTPTIIDINLADTTAFIALPGIGSKLSNRIITFREKLGGFYKVEQIGETFGLPDSTFQKIKPRLSVNNAVVKQININSVSLDELKLHPYFRYAIANAVVQYRNQHGKFSAITDIKKVMLVTDEIYNKIYPYLKVD